MPVPQTRRMDYYYDDAGVVLLVMTDHVRLVISREMTFSDCHALHRRRIVGDHRYCCEIVWTYGTVVSLVTSYHCFHVM